MPNDLERPLTAIVCPHIYNGQHPLHVRFAKYRCRILYQYWHTLLPHNPVGVQRIALESTERCPAGKTCLASFLNRSLAWSILNLHDIFAALSLAEVALARAYADRNFKLVRSGLHADLNKARKKDCEKLMTRLDSLLTTESNIVSTLQKNEKGRPYQLKELTNAFTKRIRTLPEDGDGIPNITPFLHKATSVLQDLSGRPADYEIPAWAVTSLDVDFDVNDTHLVGRGGFGRVVEGEWNGKVVAVKELSTPNLSTAAMDSIRHEVQIWSRLSHVNVLPFYGACLESLKPFIVSELCTAGNAIIYVRQHPHANRQELMRGIASGMVYLHQHGVIHADLKASNILIGNTGEALIADFGLSQLQDQVSSSIHITRTSAEKVGGTFRWMAPELLAGKGLNKPADIYSFALTAWELYTNGAVPFGNITDKRQLSALVGRGERPARPVEMGDGMWGLLQLCWRHEPSERPNFVEIRRMMIQLSGGNGRVERRTSADAALPSQSLLSSHPKSTQPTEVQEQPQPQSPVVTPTKRRFSLSTSKNSDGKSSFLKGLVTTKSNGSSKEQKAACISPNSRYSEKHRRASDELGFLVHAHNLPSLSWIPSTSGPNAPSMEVTLIFLYDHSLKPEGVAEVLAETGLVPAAIIRLLKPGLPENERSLLLGFLANLACHANGRSAIMNEPQTMLVLSTFLRASHPASVIENATRCLYNLSTEDKNHHHLAEAENAVFSLGAILLAGPSEAIAKNVLGYLTNLSLKDPGRSVVLSSRDAIDGLLHALRPGMDDVMREQALLCIGNLSVDLEKGATALLSHSELIPTLSACLSLGFSPTPAIKAQALRCLRNLAKPSSSHASINIHPEIMSTVCEVLALRAASNQQKYALHLLHRFTSSALGRSWLRRERQVWGSLRWYVDNGSSEDQARASHCLKIVQDLQ